MCARMCAGARHKGNRLAARSQPFIGRHSFEKEPPLWLVAALLAAGLSGSSLWRLLAGARTAP